MITLTYNIFLSNDGLRATHKLKNMALSGRNAFAVKKIMDGVKTAMKEFNTIHSKEIVEKYAEKDEAGKVKADPQRPGAFVPLAATEKEMHEALEKLGTVEFKIKRPQLEIDQIESNQLSARELEFLAPLFKESNDEGE